MSVFVLVLGASGVFGPLPPEGAEAQTAPPEEVRDPGFLWAEQFGTDANDNARSVAVGPDDGSAFAVGSTNGSLDPTGSPVDPSSLPSDTTPPQVNVNKGGQDAFARKHDRDGSWEWTRQFGSALSDDAFDVATDRQGNVYVAGVGDPAGRGTSGGYIRKYDAEGNTSTATTGEVWTKQFSNGRIQTFAADPEGNVYVAFNTGQDVFVYKYGPTGAFEASEPFGAFCNLSDISFGSTVGGSSADAGVYITGITSGQIDSAGRNCVTNAGITNGTNDQYLIKFDGDLNKKWHRQFGSDYGTGITLGVAVDSEDKAYVVGYTNGEITDPAVFGEETNQGGRDFYIVKFEEYFDTSKGKDEGRIVWSEQFGTSGSDLARDVVVSPDDELYVVGSSDGTFEGGNLGAGGTDAFVGKYDKDGNELELRTFGSTGSDFANGVAYDGFDDSVLVAGSTDGSLGDNQNNGGTDGFLVKVQSEDLGGPPPPSPGAEKTPVILVPGGGGSRLNYDTPTDSSEKWPNGPRYALPGDDEPLLDLRLNDNGVDPYNSEDRYLTEVGDIIRTEVGKDIYESTIERFEEAGYVEGKTLFPFPLDWRKDASKAEGAGDLYGQQDDMTLPEFIDYVRVKRGEFPAGDSIDRKVDIVAHSQGGLVTMDALRDANTNLPDGTSKVRKVLTLGTPVLGATKALALLQYQAGCFPSEFPLNGECIANPATLQKTVTNFPGIYQLLPSRRMQEAEGSPLVVEMDEDGDGQPDGEKPYDYWTGVTNPDHDDSVSRDRNAALMQAADTFHQASDDLSAAPLADPSIVVQGNFVRIVGDSSATPDYIRKYEDNDPADCLAADEADINVVCGPGENVEYELEMTRNDTLEGGDGTVPLHSADLYNPDRGIDLRGGVPNFYAHGVEHGSLPIDDSVLRFALSFLSADPPETQSGARQASVARESLFSMRTAQAQQLDDLVGLAEENGLDTEPESFSGVELVTEGPVSGFVEDGEGRTLGEDPGAPGVATTEDIPGGDYNFISDSRSFFLNEEGSYTARLLALEGTENVKLKVRTYAEGQLTGQAFFRVEPAAGDALALTLSSGQTLEELRLTVSGAGGGTSDLETGPASVVTGPAAIETDAPTTTAATKLVLPEPPRRGDEDEEDDEDRGRPRPTEALVTLSAEDGPTGSGVAATYYQLEGDAQPRAYEDPFEAPLGTVVRFASSDKAGNSEAPKELLVDDGPNEPRSAESVSPGAKLSRYVDPKGDEDWFVLEADGRSSYRAKLHGLPADYDIEAYDEAGRRIAAPAKRGKRSEEVSLGRPTAGRYYLRVVGYGGAWNPDRPYKLDLGRPGGKEEDD